MRFKWRQFWFTDIVVAEIKDRLLIVAFDRENFLENSLKPLIFALRILDVFLKKIDVRICLNLNEVGWFDGFLDTSEVNTFRPSA